MLQEAMLVIFCTVLWLSLWIWSTRMQCEREKIDIQIQQSNNLPDNMYSKEFSNFLFEKE